MKLQPSERSLFLLFYLFPFPYELLNSFRSMLTVFPQTTGVKRATCFQYLLKLWFC